MKINLGNVTGLIRSVDPPTKTYVIWAKMADAEHPYDVELYHYVSGEWVKLEGGINFEIGSGLSNESGTLKLGVTPLDRQTPLYLDEFNIAIQSAETLPSGLHALTTFSPGYTEFKFIDNTGSIKRKEFRLDENKLTIRDDVNEFGVKLHAPYDGSDDPLWLPYWEFIENKLAGKLGGTVTSNITVTNGSKGLMVFDPSYGIVMLSGTGINYVIDDQGLRVLSDYSTLNPTNLISKEQAEALMATIPNNINREVATFGDLPNDAVDKEQIYVVDASGDTTVNSGWAIYQSIGDKPSGSWIKLMEQESLDLDLSTKADITYVDAQDAKKEQITPTCFASFSGGVTATAATGLSLSAQPRMVDVNFANVNSGSGTYTLNVDGTGALALYDSRTDALHTKNSIPNGKYITLIRRNNRYYTTGIEGTNDQLNALETFALSGNNYVVERDYSSLPSWIRGRVSSTNPTTTPQLLLKLAGEVAVGYNVVDANGKSINAQGFKIGVFYTFEYNVTDNHYRVLQINKEVYCSDITTGTDLSSTESGRKLFQYNSGSNGSITIGADTLRNGGTMAFNCLAAGRLQVNVSGVTLTDNLGLNNVAQTFTIYRDESGIYYMN